MLRFRRIHFSIHGPVHNHFNADRSLPSRNDDKAARAAALAQWRQLCAI
jgi:putative transposase